MAGEHSPIEPSMLDGSLIVSLLSRVHRGEAQVAPSRVPCGNFFCVIDHSFFWNFLLFVFLTVDKLVNRYATNNPLNHRCDTIQDLWRNGQRVCLRSRRFQVRLLAGS